MGILNILNNNIITIFNIIVNFLWQYWFYRNYKSINNLMIKLCLRTKSLYRIPLNDNGYNY